MNKKKALQTQANSSCTNNSCRYEYKCSTRWQQEHILRKKHFLCSTSAHKKSFNAFFLTDFSLYLRIVPLYVLTGKAKTKEARQTIINPDWNFEKMGIGGLDKEFSDIFRRAFASRVFPPDIVEQMGEEPFSHLY